MNKLMSNHFNGYLHLSKSKQEFISVIPGYYFKHIKFKKTEGGID